MRLFVVSSFCFEWIFFILKYFCCIHFCNRVYLNYHFDKSYFLSLVFSPFWNLLQGALRCQWVWDGFLVSAKQSHRDEANQESSILDGKASPAIWSFGCQLQLWQLNESAWKFDLCKFHSRCWQDWCRWTGQSSHWAASYQLQFFPRGFFKVVNDALNNWTKWFQPQSLDQGTAHRSCNTPRKDWEAVLSRYWGPNSSF